MKHEPARVAVIDVGSNSIKLLVAARGEEKDIETLATDIRETRISTGMYGKPPTISPECIRAAVDSVKQLLEVAAGYAPDKVILVATSAVREADNGVHFADCLTRETGLPLRVLDEDREAYYICRGALCDPSLKNIRTGFRLFDLGGGSLEIIHCSDPDQSHAVSLPLGGVRLTEMFISNPADRVKAVELESIKTHIIQCMESKSPDLSTPGLPLVGSGGALATIRNLIQPRSRKIPLPALVRWRDRLASLSLPERRAIPGVPYSRADIMVAALQVMITLLEMAGRESILYTGYNLRYGIAREALGKR